jgi:hypothetical protein
MATPKKSTSSLTQAQKKVSEIAAEPPSSHDMPSSSKKNTLNESVHNRDKQKS